MEIIILFYMGITLAIGWCIFSPFAALGDIRVWSFAKLETTDLFALFLPYALTFALLPWVTPEIKLTLTIAALVAAGISLFVAMGLVAGLFMLAKMKRISSAKRMALIGIVFPMGLTLTIAWVAFPLAAFARSTTDSIWVTLAIGLVSIALRGISSWICSGIKPA